MVKKIGNEGTATKQEKSLAEVMAENEALLQRIEEMNNIDPIALEYLKEERKIRQSARVDADKLVVKEINDHKNVSLWTKWGKRIGPMHRDNALRALRNFVSFGVMLSSTQPTEADIEKWLASKEGIAWKKSEDKKRDDNISTRKRGSMEKILKQMADQYGLTMGALSGILKPGEVKPLSQAQDMR